MRVPRIMPSVHKVATAYRNAEKSKFCIHLKSLNLLLIKLLESLVSGEQTGQSHVEEVRSHRRMVDTVRISMVYPRTTVIANQVHRIDLRIPTQFREVDDRLQPVVDVVVLERHEYQCLHVDYSQLTD